MKQRPAEHYIRTCRQRSAPQRDHAPLPFKGYHDCSVIPLSAETVGALTHERDQSHLLSFGVILQEMYGITRMTVHTEQGAPLAPARLARWTSSADPYELLHCRTVASGGGLFPCELYLLVGTGQSLAAGLYHYDPAHHALHVLRLGATMHVLLEGLWRTPARQPDYAFLLSTAFWKNGFKYQEFSYRLQALDTGCLLTQVQLVAEHYQLEPTIHLRFLDAKMDDFLGLDPNVESVYAIVTVNDSRDQSTLPQAIHEPQPPYQRAGLPKMRDQYQALTHWPLVEALHRASQIDTKIEMHAGLLPRLALPASGSMEIELPAMPYRYERGDACNRRSSEPEHFRARSLTLKELALLLHAGAQGYRCDLDGKRGAISHTTLCCVINHVEGIPPGVYLYQPARHCLRTQRLGNFQPALQETQPGSWLQNANISLCIVPVGNYKGGFDAYGDRWYRMQNMEAGMVTQRIYLACAASALGCRASLTFRDEATDELLALPKDYTSLIQILVSPLDRVLHPQGIGDRHFLW